MAEQADEEPQSSLVLDAHAMLQAHDELARNSMAV